MNPFDKILIKTPKASRFDQHNTNKLSMQAGKLVPIWWKDMSPNEQIKLKLSSLVKTAPMVAPIFDRLKMECFAFFVPYRIIWDGAEEFFNLSTKVDDRPPMPQILGYFGNKQLWVNNRATYDCFNQKGDLMEYLGYPIFNNYISYYVRELLTQNDVYKQPTRYSVGSGEFTVMPLFRRGSNWVAADIDNNWWSVPSIRTKWLSNRDVPFEFDFGTSVNTSNMIMSFTMWLLAKLFDANGLIDHSSTEAEYQTTFGTPISDLGIIPVVQTGNTSSSDVFYFSNDDIYKLALDQLPYDTLDQLKEEYNRYLFNRFLSIVYTNGNSEFYTFFKQDSDGQDLRDSLLRSSLTKRAYWRIVADWFVNSNFEDPEAIIQTYVKTDYSDNLTPDAYHLANRYWESDYFTSAFASTQSGTDVPIPVNGSIKDLRNANSLQKVMELVLYSGKRYIDQIRTFFGAKSSDSRLDRAEVIGKSDFIFGIDEITQMSEGSVDNPLGSFAGRALTAGNDQMFHYKCEEHGMIMILASIKPLASYIGVQDRFYFKKSPYDFLIPQFANVGEQEILSDELQQKIPTAMSDVGRVFGYNRRYSEYMFKHNEVHGDFIDNMDFWTMARKFDVIPTLNADFLQITPSDNINRAFALPYANNHYYCYFAFDFKDVNALPRYLHYDL